MKDLLTSTGSKSSQGQSRARCRVGGSLGGNNCSDRDWMKVDQGRGLHVLVVRGRQVNTAKTKGQFSEMPRTYNWV